MSAVWTSRSVCRHAALCATLAAVLWPALAAAQGSDARTQGVIRWQAGTASTSHQDASQIAQAVDAARGAAARHVLIQFERPIGDAQREALEQAGVRLLGYVDDNAYYAVLDSTRADGAALGASPDVRCILPMQRQWKLHPDILANDYPDYAVVAEPAPAGANLDDGGVHKPVAAEKTVAAYVMFQADVSDGEMQRIATAHGARIVRTLGVIHTLVVELPIANLNALADEDGVQWIEPPLPGLEPVNDSNRARVGADTVQAPPYSLNGAGVSVLVYDGGQVLSTHQDLSPRVTIGPNDNSGIAAHPTHVAGTIGGTGVASGGLRKGMAPAVSIISFGLEQVGGLHEGFLYTDPGDLAQDYTWAIQHGADISNNSIGTNTAPNGYPCEWEGNYGITDVLIDTIVRGDGSDPNNPQFNQPFRIVWANGNERQVGRCLGSLGGYRSTAPPACAKNHITVGAMNSNDDTVTSFTSWGPSDDGRIKPDISAPGCQSNDDDGVTSCSSFSNTAYTTMCGTSMASPTTCGVSALILQDFRQQFPGEPDFRNSTLKAILAQTALDIDPNISPGTTVGPDYRTGYGSIRAPAAINLLRAGNFLENAIPTTGATFTATIIVAPGEAPLKVTLAWDDKPGNPAVQNQLVNDLDLRVFDSQNNQYFPWTLGGLANPSAPAVRTQADHANNIEQVVIDNPTPGGYRVEVYGFNVPQGPQPFSLAASPLLVNCSSLGSVSLDATKYRCDSTVTMSVIDCDLNTSDLVIDTATVTLKSTSNPTGIPVVLTEVAPAAASFLGTATLSTNPGPGQLLVAPGDTVTMIYNDADNGNGQPATAAANAFVDCTPPGIGVVTVNPINPHNATVNFSTNESARVTIRYGLSCDALDHSVVDSGFHATHNVLIENLLDNTPYFFQIDAVDTVGNAATYTNGSCYTFATPEAPDFFTEDFSTPPANSLDNMSLIWTLNGSLDFYALCRETPMVEFPNDPNEGTSLGFTNDDEFKVVSLTGGQTVKLYTGSYNTLYVGSNGYITFGSGDTDGAPTLTKHFSKPRIAALYDHLSPRAAAARATWKQYADRVVVSFVNVPRVGLSDSNSFQYELFFDGTIAIHYLGLAAPDGIAGLSRGLGLSPDFLESPLSTYPSCGPRPPHASTVSAQTAVNVNVGVSLVAYDDGLPNPPAALTYKIVSLPSQGRLFDPGAGQITTLPYTLVNGGHVVTYDPPSIFQGQTSFTYRANDGGVAPDGGDSNLALAQITVGGVQLVYSFPLDTNPGWTTQGQWAWGQPTGASGGFGFDPVGGHTGPNVYGYNLNGGYANSLPERNLTSTAIDCHNISQVKVRFWRWLGVEGNAYDHAYFRASNNGLSWRTIWQNPADDINDSQWTQVEYDISTTADNKPAVLLRWTMGVTDGNVTYQGWNIDDVEVWGLVAILPQGCPGDLNCDGTVDFADIDLFVEALSYPGGGGWPNDCPWINGDCNNDNFVDFADIDSFVNLLFSDCP